MVSFTVSITVTNVIHSAPTRSKSLTGQLFMVSLGHSVLVILVSIATVLNLLVLINGIEEFRSLKTAIGKINKCFVIVMSIGD